VTGTDPLDHATAYLGAGRPEQARRIIAAHLASHPDDPRALCLMSQAHRELDDHELSLESARAALRVDPDNEWAWRLVSLAESRLGNYEAAHGAADAVRRLRPDSWLSHTNYAQVDATARRVTVATHTALARAFDLGPSQAQVHLVAGNVAMAENRWSVAATAFREALRIEPQNQAARNNLALAQLRSLNHGRAARTFSELLADDPDSALALRNLRVAARAALRTVHLILWIGVLLAVFYYSSTVYSVKYPDFPMFAVAATAEVIAVAAYLVRFRVGSGSRFAVIARSMYSIDRGLIWWAGCLAVALAASVVFAFLPPQVGTVYRYALLVPLIAGIVIARTTARLP
jgi:tetratricopeptide (TPR) repeat protein